MEFPPKVVRAQRGLALALLAAVGLLAWRESRSELSARLRRQEPWYSWLAVSPEPSARAPLLFLAAYHPSRRALDLVFIPDGSRFEGGKSLSEIYRRVSRPQEDSEDRARALAEEVQGLISPEVPGANDEPLRGPGLVPFLYARPPSWPGLEPPLAAKAWILGQSQGISFWTGLAGNLRRPAAASLGAFDRLLLALEIHRLTPESIHPVWLPERELRRAWFGRISGQSVTAVSERPLAVEVLNATAKKGIASKATKVLRLRGADVVNFGSIPAPQPKTVIYDRTGRLENAEAVRWMLGCRAAETATQINLKRLVDVTVVLAEDCSDDARAP